MSGDILTQAQRSGGYEQASRLLQVLDEDWVLGFLPSEPRAVLDLGCGTGSLLTRLAGRPTVRVLHGVDRSADRIATARQRISELGFSGDLRLDTGDLTALPTVGGPYDVAVMSAVLHWLYPDEAAVFRWVASHLVAHGVFVFTSHHPPTAADGLGGTDEVVREALRLLGVPEPVRTLFDNEGIIPFGTRTRGRAVLETLVREHFTVTDVAERRAVMRVASGAEYASFHAATFGTSYSGLVAPQRRQDFFDALAEVAERRMRESGVVTDHPVRLWHCVVR